MVEECTLPPYVVGFSKFSILKVDHQQVSKIFHFKIDVIFLYFYRIIINKFRQCFKSIQHKVLDYSMAIHAQTVAFGGVISWPLHQTSHELFSKVQFDVSCIPFGIPTPQLKSPDSA